VLELYQAEWCPSSSRVRQRLTELGVDFVARQVPVEREDRGALRRLSGGEGIPVLVLEDGSKVRGEDDIRAYLDRRFEESPETKAHRRKAATIRRRELEEAAPCVKLSRRAAPTRARAAGRSQGASGR